MIEIKTIKDIVGVKFGIKDRLRLIINNTTANKITRYLVLFLSELNVFIIMFYARNHF